VRTFPAPEAPMTAIFASAYGAGVLTAADTDPGGVTAYLLLDDCEAPALIQKT